jgi:hypothetical protein
MVKKLWGTDADPLAHKGDQKSQPMKNRGLAQIPD